jgi:hypothetical protein
MPVRMPLDRLERVGLRDAWLNEAGDFTPWLASPENIVLLGEAVGLSLEVESTECGVGPFRADILCRNQVDNTFVLIENQIESTDHAHLGQLLTYAAGLEAVTIIWVAAKFTDEHRAALDWLNTITDEKFNFFGLEIELWRIGASPAAPKFNVVCQPNEWVRTTGKAILNREGLSPTRQRQQEYWTEFKALLDRSGSKLRTGVARPDASLPVALGRNGFVLRAIASPNSPLGNPAVPQPHIRAQFSIEHDESAGMYRALLARANEIDQKLGEPLTWMVLNESVRRQRAFVHLDANLADRADWPRQHQWLKDRLEKMVAVFGPIVRELQPLSSEGAPAAGL